MQAVLDLLVDIASAAPSLMSGSKRAVEALLAEDHSELAVLAARLLSAASGAVPPLGGGRTTSPLEDAPVFKQKARPFDGWSACQSRAARLSR